jgi:serine/threonine protein kinase
VTNGQDADDPRLLALAQSIAEGEAVNWADVPPVDDPDTAAALEQLRALEPLVRWGDPIPDRWGPFTITGELGRGSFGTVYRAHDPTLQIDVALKVIRSVETAVPARGLNEARMLAQVTHPHVVRVYRVEQVGADIGVAMELVHGRTLHDLVRRHGFFNANDAARIGIELCEALSAVHAAGLVHADVKAQNVMHAAARGTILMDFGAGTDLKRDESRAGSGTPLYMAPEMVAGEPPTTVSDVYSLGVLLYYLVTGSYPVEADSRTGVERAHDRRESRRSLAAARPELPRGFVNIVERASAEKARDRYPSATALQTALKRGLATEWRTFDWKPWAIAALLALSIGGWLAYSMFRIESPAPTEIKVDTRKPDVPVSSAAPGTYRIEAAMFRFDNGGEVRLGPGSPVGPDDRLSMEVRASVPVHVYVVNEDDMGESWLLFPIPGQGLANPLPAGQRHRLPGTLGGEDMYWQVTSLGGREHFVVFASPEPLSPALTNLLEKLPRPTLGRPVIAHPLPEAVVPVLRGVGGLAARPPAAGGPRIADRSYTSLSGVEEELSGTLVRQITFENRGR